MNLTARACFGASIVAFATASCGGNATAPIPNAVMPARGVAPGGKVFRTTFTTS